MMIAPRWVRAAIVVGFLLSSIPITTPATAQDGETKAKCFYGLIPPIVNDNSGNSQTHGCFEPLYSIDPYWSRIGASFNLFGLNASGNEVKSFYGIVAFGGAQYHIWDDRWDRDERIAPFGMLGVTAGTKHFVASLGGSYQPDSRRLTLQVGAPSGEDINKLGGALTLGLGTTLGRKKRQLRPVFIGINAGIAVSSVSISSKDVTSSLQDYTNTVKLVLVESKPLSREKVTGLFVDPWVGLRLRTTAAARESDASLVFNDLHAQFKATYFGGTESTSLLVQAANEFVLGLFPFGPFGRDGFLEFRGRLTTRLALSDNVPAFLLPSIGGSDFAMLTMPEGSYLSSCVVTAGAQVGPSFVRAFVEGGWSCSNDDITPKVGFGGAIAFPRMMSAFIDEYMPGTAALGIGPQSLELILGGTLGERFVAKLNGSVAF